MDQTIQMAIKIVTKLMNGEDVNRIENSGEFEAYLSDSDIFDYVNQFVEGFGLELIDDFGDGLYLSCGVNNKVFGYSNEELRKRLKINNNSELYMIYFILYGVILEFYADSFTPTYKTYLKRGELVHNIDQLLKNIISDIASFTSDDIKYDSFKQIAMLWDNMPILSSSEVEDINRIKVNQYSKAGYVKKLMQFLKEEKLFIEENDMYYPSNRFHALAQNYFRKKGSDIYALLNQNKRGMKDA